MSEFNRLAKVKTFFLVILMAFVSGLNAADSQSSLPLLDASRFAELRSVVSRTRFPIARSAFVRTIGRENGAKWVFDRAEGKADQVSHFAYFAVGPYIPGAGSFCVEAKYVNKGLDPTDDIASARLCFVSAFGAIFYEEKG